MRAWLLILAVGGALIFFHGMQQNERREAREGSLPAVSAAVGISGSDYEAKRRALQEKLEAR